jgi:hypothetical protein
MLGSGTAAVLYGNDGSADDRAGTVMARCGLALVAGVVMASRLEPRILAACLSDFTTS